MSDYFENKNGQNSDRENAKNQKVKLRLRLKSGEEFEAEGSLPFVLEQKDEFLTQNAPYLKTRQPVIRTKKIEPAPDFAPQNEILSQPSNEVTHQPKPDFTPEPESQQAEPAQPEPTIVTPAEYNLHIPAIRRRQMEAERKIHTVNTPAIPDGSIGTNPSTNDGQNWQSDEKIWLKVAYLDGTDIVLRRKIKDLKPGIAALITLAAAKMLAGITKMTALELSKSLRMSGYLKGGERLDRILTAEIKAGTLFFEGSKRNREYIISQTGTAKAYTSAEHFLL